MDHPTDNARRLLQLLERLRPQLLGPAFRRLSELQLSPSHLRLLRILQAASPLAMKDLADQLGLTPPSVTALTRRLVTTGLVARRHHETDSRVVLLELTPAGHTLHAELTAEQLEQMDRLLAGLSGEEQSQLLDLLERAIRAGPAGSGCGPPRE